jgi:type IV pilus assembly protein PilO
MNILEMITKISLVKKLAVLGVFVALAGGLYWYLFYSVLSDEIDGLKNQYVQLERQKQDAIRRKSTYDKDRHRRDELKKTYAQQMRALPAESEMSSFLNNLNSQAELVGLELQSVKPQRESASQYYARIPVSLDLEGNYLQLAKFFYLVGNLDRIINIENISFRVGSVDESGIKLKVQVMATTFRSVGSESEEKG